MHKFALGVMASRGRFEGSYTEVGFGSTDIFTDKPDDRWKLDARLSWHPPYLARGGLSPFARIVVDADLGSGADSIQSYFGFALDVRKLFGASELVR